MPDGGTRQALISAAIGSLRSGRAVPSLQQLARAAGLTTGAVYSQFGNRALLLLEVAFSEGGSAIVSAVDHPEELKHLTDALPFGAPIDPLVAAIVEAATDQLATDSTANRLGDLCGSDPARHGRLSIGLAHALLSSVGVAGPTTDALRRALRQYR